MEKDYAECANLKIFRQETKFLADKMTEKIDFVSIVPQKMPENAISAATKKPQTFNGTWFHSFLQNERNYNSSERGADYTCNISNKVYL